MRSQCHLLFFHVSPKAACLVSCHLFLSSVQRVECSISLQSAVICVPLGRSLVSLVCVCVSW